MQSKAETVDAYIAEAPPERRRALEQVRELCLKELPGHEEAMRWGMAAYSRNGEAEFAFASQKQYLALYLMKAEVAQAHGQELVGLDMGKGCVRYRKPEAIDYDLWAKLLRATAESAEKPC